MRGRLRRLERRFGNFGPQPKCQKCCDVPVMEYNFDSRRGRFPFRKPCEACGSPRRIRIKVQKPREDLEQSGRWKA